MQHQRLSESVTGQSCPKPTREEKDAAFSSGAGRKAVEVPIEEASDSKELCDLEAQPDHNTSEKGGSDHRSGSDHEAPVGLDLETRGEKDMDHPVA